MTETDAAVTDRATTDARPVAAVLFDMDGTLVDSDAAVERSWRRWARRYEVDEDHVVAIMAGHPTETTIGAVRPDLTGADLDAAAAHHLDLECDDVDGVVATPGATELLAALDGAGVPWAVVTSAVERLATIRLRAAGVVAPVVIPRDALAVGKPDPAGYLLAARRLGVDPAACLVVEDTPVGAAAGRASGARVAALKGLTGPADVDHPITTLHDVHSLLRSEERA